MGAQAMDLFEITNLGHAIFDRPDDHPWLIEIGEAGEERRFGYGALRRQAAAVARALRRRGLPDGARIGMLGRNSAEYLITYFGIMQAGYCPVPIGYKLARDTVEHILSDAAIVFMYTDRDCAGRLPSGLPRIDLDDRAAWNAHLDPGPRPDMPMRPGDFATILYTSGSTGVPKGVPLTHGGYLWTLRQVAMLGGDFMRDTAAAVLAAAPLSHMNALFMSKTITAYGGTEILMGQFNAREYLRATDRHGCSIVSAVPTMLALCARERDLLAELDLGRVRTVAMGSAPVTDALFEQVRAMFPNAAVQNGWGSTETGPAVFGPHPQGLPRPPLSIGHPLPTVEVRLVAPDAPDPLAAPGLDEGELYVRNGAIMPGYLNREADNRKRLFGGWYKTGDIMRRDANGFFFFVSRADDMFVCGGENIYPGEVERLLERHPAVAQAAVVPIADEIKGQIPAAFVVRKPGAQATADEIKAFALANAPAYQHPRFVLFLDALPLSAANKVDKKQLLAQTTGLKR